MHCIPSMFHIVLKSDEFSFSNFAVSLTRIADLSELSPLGPLVVLGFSRRVAAGYKKRKHTILHNLPQ